MTIELEDSIVYKLPVGFKVADLKMGGNVSGLKVSLVFPVRGSGGRH